jgi:hypothetical protein
MYNTYMAYARFFADEVYVYAMHKGVICAMCYFCDDTAPSFTAESTQEMIDHLKAHQRVGHSMPSTIFEDLIADDAENYPDNPYQPE